MDSPRPITTNNIQRHGEPPGHLRGPCLLAPSVIALLTGLILTTGAGLHGCAGIPTRGKPVADSPEMANQPQIAAPVPAPAPTPAHSSTATTTATPGSASPAPGINPSPDTAPEDRPPDRPENNLTDTTRQETQALYMVAISHARAKEYPQAIGAMKQATAMVPDSPFLKAELVQLLVEADDYHGALDTARQALNRHPHSVLLLLTFATVAADMAHTKEAIAACQTATRVAPQNGDPYRMLAWLQQRDDQWEEAHQTLVTWTGAIPQDPEAWFLLGELFLGANRDQEAICHYRKALELEPTHLNANYQLGRIFRARGDLEQAIDHYRVVFQQAPHNMNGGLTLARMLLATGNEAEGAGVLESIRSIFKSDPAMDFIVVEMLIEFNLTKRAIQTATERLKMDPSLLEGKLLIAKALHRAGQYEEALEHLAKLKPIGPTGARGEILTARIAIEHEKAPQKALLHLERALQILPEHSRAWELCGDAHLSTGEKEKAARCFEKAIRFAPEKEEREALAAKLAKIRGQIQATESP